MMRTDQYLNNVELISNAFHYVFFAFNLDFQREFSSIIHHHNNQCHQRSIFPCFNVTTR